MKEIMNEWRKFTLLKESMLEYDADVKLVQGYIDNPKSTSVSDYWKVVEASKRIISNKNQQYWRYAGQYGKENNLTASEPNSVWNKALELAGTHATPSETEPIGTKLQRDTYKDFKINIPFLDPSTSPGLHPWWRKNNLIKTGAFLQTATNIFLDAESVAFIILSFFTAGLAAMGKVMSPSLIKVFNYIHTVMEFKSMNGKASYSAFQEIEKVCREALNKILSSPYPNKIILGQETKVVKYETLLKPMTQNAGSIVVGSFINFIQSEIVPFFVSRIEDIMVKYPTKSLAVTDNNLIAAVGDNKNEKANK